MGLFDGSGKRDRSEAFDLRLSELERLEVPRLAAELVELVWGEGGRGVDRADGIGQSEAVHALAGGVPDRGRLQPLKMLTIEALNALQAAGLVASEVHTHIELFHITRAGRRALESGETESVTSAALPQV